MTNRVIPNKAIDVIFHSPCLGIISVQSANTNVHKFSMIA